MIDVTNTPRRLRLRACGIDLTLILSLMVTLASHGMAQDFYPLRDVHPGLVGVGRTVFNGNQVEEFQVQVLGVLENLTPRQTIILAKLSGGPLGETGVMQGMSGSPVYIDGKLLGAVALGFPFSKQAIAGIQPIEQMLSPDPLVVREKVVAHDSGRNDPNVQKLSFNAGSEGGIGPTTPLIGDLREIFTPLSLAGFTPRTVQVFADRFRQLGLDPQQGVSAGTPISQNLTGKVVPGSMISVQLLSGDMSVSADGTVTYINKDRVYAFGHRFLDSGTTDLPFARADVVALLPSLNSSFKLSAAREWVGSITSDLSTAIAGQVGRRAQTAPLTISVRSSGGAHTYNMRVVNDRLLTPFVTQTALFSAIDATERTTGGGTLRISGEVQFEGGMPPLRIRDVFVSDTGVAQQASAESVIPMSFVLAAGFQNLRVGKISYSIEPLDKKQQLRIAQAWTSHSQVRPGETVEVSVLLQGEDGYETTKTAAYRVPAGAPTGGLNITVSDALTLNTPDFAGLSQSALHSPQQLVEAINEYRGSDAAYVRFWRQQASFVVSGPMPNGELTDPPPSVALILADASSSPTSSAAAALLRGSQVAEVKVPVAGYAVSGARTIQVEVID